MSDSPAPASPFDAATREGIVVRLRAAGCVFAEDEAALLEEAASHGNGAPASASDRLERLVAARVSGLPLEPLVGWAAFHGLRIQVTPGVFVPRQRTAFLVDEALARLHGGERVLDLCCGTGAVGAAIADGVARRRTADSAAGDGAAVEVFAADVDPAAVECARSNLAPERVFEGDLFGALPAGLRGGFDLIAVNAPYVPTSAIATMPPEARLHEALVALDGGDDGLDVHRRVASAAADWLKPGGWLLIETSERQAPETVALLQRAGFEAAARRSDELDGTIAVGRLPR